MTQEKQEDILYGLDNFLNMSVNQDDDSLALRMSGLTSSIKMSIRSSVKQ